MSSFHPSTVVGRTGMTRLGDIDLSLLLWMNGFAGHSVRVDNGIRVLSEWHFFRSAWLGMFLVWAWFRFRDGDTRLKLIAGIVGVVIATAASKIIQVTAFVHPRPFNMAAGLGLTLPHNLDTGWGTNSYPSDTSTLYFALAAVIFSVSRAWGVLAFIWVTTVIAVPRVFLLYHWPSDIAAGFLLGISVVALIQVNRNSLASLGWMASLENISPQAFYPAMFIIVYQVIDCFDAVEVTLYQISALRHLALH